VDNHRICSMEIVLGLEMRIWDMGIPMDGDTERKETRE